MKNIALRIIAFVFLSVILSHKVQAQQPSSTYLPHTLIIKYEDEEKLSRLRIKQGADPRANVRQYLSTFGANRPVPLWEAGSLRDFSPNRSRSMNAKKVRSATSELQRIHSVHFLADVDPAWLAAKVEQLPGIEYAEPRYLRKTQLVPNDPIENDYEQFHQFVSGWEFTTGSSEVIIAIVDSGVDYNHTDLDDKLWINQDEVPSALQSQVDEDGNGTITPTEIYQYLQQEGTDYNGDGQIDLQDAVTTSSPFMNNNDRDKNSRIDDIVGWDFWSSGYTDGTITEDNNPMMDVSSHGTHVAGIAAAETDNDFGMAAAGFNSTYMAIKGGGVPDDPGTSVDESQLIGFGMEGIVYAAENGADIINCSWGGGSFSEAENDVIRYATSLGALVVGASGNSGLTEVIYPAAYEDAVAVGAVGLDSRPEQYSNIGYKLDVLATGTQIQSTIGNNGFGFSTGTSMSTPVVSGLAALLRAQYPGWSPRRMATHLRATSIPLVGSPLVNRLGHGKIDAEAALNPENANLPGIDLLNARFVNEQGQKLGFAEPGTIEVRLANYGAATNNLTIDVRSMAGGIQLPNATIQQGSIPTGDTVEVSIPIQITNDFNLEEIPTFRVQFVDAPASYSDFSMITYDQLLYDVMAANNVKMSVSADGTIGFTHPLEQRGGVGFIPREKTEQGYREGENLLFEGGLMLHMSGQIFDAVRSSEGELSRDFNPQSTFRLDQTSARADLMGTTRFSTDTLNNVFAHVEVNSFAFKDPDLSNIVYLQYDIQNPSSFVELKEVYAGLFNDWDIGPSSNNGASYSRQDSILYLYDEAPETSHPMVAVATLGPQSSVLAINNAAEGRGANFGIYDGFTDQEKELSLKAGTQQTQISGTDVSAVVASGPYTVGPRARVKIGFVYGFGADLSTLRSQIAEARSQAPFRVSNQGLVVSEEEPEETAFFQNYPNPFYGSTRLRLDLSSKTHVNISVYNVLGRKVAEVVDKELDPRIHIFNFDSRNLSSGIYFARLQTDTRSKTIKMVLVK